MATNKVAPSFKVSQNFRKLSVKRVKNRKIEDDKVKENKKVQNELQVNDFQVDENGEIVENKESSPQNLNEQKQTPPQEEHLLRLLGKVPSFRDIKIASVASMKKKDDVSFM